MNISILLFYINLVTLLQNIQSLLVHGIDSDNTNYRFVALRNSDITNGRKGGLLLPDIATNQ